MCILQINREECVVSRYIREIDLQLPEDEVQGLIDGFLKGNGFYRDEWQGKICWTADFGMNMAVSPLRVTEANTRIY